MSSPFRSTSDTRRVRAALTISLDEVLVAIEALKKEIRQETDAKRKRHLKTRLRATQAHYQGWADYVGQACPRVTNATERPRPKRSSK